MDWPTTSVAIGNSSGIPELLDPNSRISRAFIWAQAGENSQCTGAGQDDDRIDDHCLPSMPPGYAAKLPRGLAPWVDLVLNDVRPVGAPPMMYGHEVAIRIRKSRPADDHFITPFVVQNNFVLNPSSPTLITFDTPPGRSMYWFTWNWPVKTDVRFAYVHSHKSLDRKCFVLAAAPAALGLNKPPFVVKKYHAAQTADDATLDELERRMGASPALRCIYNPVYSVEEVDGHSYDRYSALAWQCTEYFVEKDEPVTFVGLYENKTPKVQQNHAVSFYFLAGDIGYHETVIGWQQANKKEAFGMTSPEFQSKHIVYA